MGRLEIRFISLRPLIRPPPSTHTPTSPSGCAINYFTSANTWDKFYSLGHVWITLAYNGWYSSRFQTIWMHVQTASIRSHLPTIKLLAILVSVSKHFIQVSSGGEGQYNETTFDDHVYVMLLSCPIISFIRYTITSRIYKSLLRSKSKVWRHILFENRSR